MKILRRKFPLFINSPSFFYENIYDFIYYKSRQKSTGKISRMDGLSIG